MTEQPSEPFEIASVPVRNSAIERPLTMTKRLVFSLVGFLAILLMAPPAWAMADYNTELLAIQQTWAEIKYRTPKADRRDAFASLLSKSEAFHHMYPDKADAILWSAVILYNYAGEVRGIKALGMIKQSHRMLHQAEKINPGAANGLIHTALGQLYYKVPGWPVAFGNETKAVNYLRKGVELNPDGLDANYFMGDYLLRKKHYHQAAIHLRRAIHAPPRVQRPIADAGRKADALKLLQQVEGKI